jgi:peptidyl-prolyl cis-trans isomerase D
MFDAVRNNKRIVQVFLVLITLPFAFWGVDSYIRNVHHDTDIAKIGKVGISQQRFQEALREQQERLRQTYGNVDPKMLDTPEARRAVLDGLIDQQLLLLEVQRERLFVSDAALRDVIGSIPALQEDGKFSMARYEQALQERNLTRAGFEAQMRQDMSLQQLIGGIGESTILAHTVALQLTHLQTEEREVHGYLFAPSTFAAQVKVGDTEVKDFYDKNAKQFETPEQVRVEYVVLSPESITSQVKVSEDELRKAYNDHKERYQQQEERRASHILITVDAKASDADRAKAKAQAEALLKEAKANPGKFAELAARNSRDPGSAQKGGDLGFFARGAMVKPFADAVWSLKEGEISGLVQSDFGYHIIKLTGTHAGRVRDFSEVRAEIEAELAKQEATRQFAEAADNFNNMVYEQSDSLKPVEDKYKLLPQQSGWLTRQGGGNGPLANPKLLAAIFSSDALNNHRNTESVEVATNTLVSARVIEHKPAAQQALESVRAAIVEQLRREGARALARKAGEEKLAALKGGKSDDVAWGPANSVSRINPKPLSPQALAAVFKLDGASKLPVYGGLEQPDGSYALLKVVKIGQPDRLDPNLESAISGQLANILAQEDGRAYIAALRQRYKVEIKESQLNATPDQER